MLSKRPKFFAVVSISSFSLSQPRTSRASLSRQLGPLFSILAPAHAAKRFQKKKGRPCPKQFAQTVCASSFCLFLFIEEGKGGIACTTCSDIVCANCVFIWVGVFLGVGLPSMSTRSSSKREWQNCVRSVRKCDQKVTKNDKNDRTPFADLLLRHPDKFCAQNFAPLLRALGQERESLLLSALKFSQSEDDVGQVLHPLSLSPSLPLSPLSLSAGLTCACHGGMEGRTKSVRRRVLQSDLAMASVLLGSSFLSPRQLMQDLGLIAFETLLSRTLGSVELLPDSLLWPNIANPFPPYSLPKRPKSQICPKFLPAIALGGSRRGD